MNFFDPWIQKALKRGQVYTSLDAMKFFAIVNMTADHIGDYFFPHDMWWRAIGRITFPVWFFLVGYSRSRELGEVLWTFALLLIADRPFIDLRLLPLNALISIILCRLLLNFLEDRKWLPDKIPKIIVACGFLTFFTTPIFEYGSIAFLYAIFGRMAAMKQSRYYLLLVISCYAIFIPWQFIWFKFDLFQGAYVVLGTAWVVWWLANFTNKVVWAQWDNSRWKTFVAVLSRNTLPYYFYHRLILELLSAFIVGKGFHFALRI